MGTFEIHLTLSGARSEVEAFAYATGGSALELVLEGSGESTHVTWDRVGSFEDVNAFVADLGEEASTDGIGVTRTKIEAPMSQERSGSEPAVRYFELHALVSISDDEQPTVDAISRRHGARISRRAHSSVAEDGTHERFLNLRVGSRDAAEKAFSQLVEDLKSSGVRVLKTHPEQVLVDSDLDGDWLPILDPGAVRT